MEFVMCTEIKALPSIAFSISSNNKFPLACQLILALCAIMLVPKQALAACSTNTPVDGITECHYQRFSAWVSCEHKDNLMSWFELEKDAGGSEGWNKLTSSIEAVLEKSREIN
jgi:hypothetical protein